MHPQSVTVGKPVTTDEVARRLAAQITSVRVRFIPEKHGSSNRQVVTRSLVNDDIFREEWGGTEKTETPEGDGGTETPDPSPGA